MRRNTIRAAVLVASLVTMAGCSGTGSPSGPGPSTADTTPPAAVTDLALAWSPDRGEVRIEWTSPSDDSPTERVTAYEIRLAYTTGPVPGDFWSAGMAVPDPPAPAEPGNRESYVVADPRRARDLYVGIRSIDEKGNRSAAEDPATLHVPGYAFAATCVDVFTRSPVEGLGVTLSTGRTFGYTTDSEGRFAHGDELADGVTHIEIVSGSSPTTYHPVSQSLVLGGDSLHTFFMVPVEAIHAAWAPNLLTLFKRMAKFRGGDGFAGVPPAAPQILAKWRRHPVPCYIPVFVNGHGVDYEQQSKLAAARWMERTGEPLFEFVDSPPDTGIIVSFKPSSVMGYIRGLTTYTIGSDGHPLRTDIAIANDLAGASGVYKILLHEFGHTIPLGHVDDATFIMYVAQPLPEDISDDETRVVQLHEGLPTRIDMSVYDEDSPPGAP